MIGLSSQLRFFQGERCNVTLGGGPSIPVRYGGKYEDWFLLVEISSVLLGGGRSIQLSYGGIFQCVLYPLAAGLSTKTLEKVVKPSCKQVSEGI